jgi:hypothetical protein
MLPAALLLRCELGVANGSDWSNEAKGGRGNVKSISSPVSSAKKVVRDGRRLERESAQ